MASTQKVTSKDGQDELFVTLDFDGEGWDVWFPHPMGGRQILESFVTKRKPKPLQKISTARQKNPDDAATGFPRRRFERRVVEWNKHT